MAEYENELQELVERLRPDPQAQINRLERDMSVLTEKASGLDGRISDLRSAISDLKSDFKLGSRDRPHCLRHSRGRYGARRQVDG